jgi:hypothetical protein
MSWISKLVGRGKERIRRGAYPNTSNFAQGQRKYGTTLPRFIFSKRGLTRLCLRISSCFEFPYSFFRFHGALGVKPNKLE